MELKRRHLMLAGLVAVAVHGAIAVAVFWTPQQRGAVGAGLGGLEISMGATGGAPGLAQPVAPGEASKAESYVTEKLTP
ncbi:MAG: energy transducer TonB, partial [Pseudomonadota bacterium]